MIKLGSNIAALQAQRKLGQTSSVLSRTFERLSSGLRINRAADDAAGLAIAESLKKDVRVFTQAVRNINDGMSLLNIADGTVEELSNIIIRIRELAEQSANGTYSHTQRKAIDEEAQALSDEFFRVTRAAQFNGLGLFDGSLGDGLRVQAGYGLAGSVQSTLGQGLGTGTFGGKVTATAPFSATELSMGDLNNDGLMDMVTAYSVGGVAGVSLGQGDGSFISKGTFSIESGSASDRTKAVVLGDLNGDGVLDLVTGGYVKLGSYYQGQASVFFGRGDGTFEKNGTYATERGAHNSGTENVVLGDINGDGTLDMITGGTQRDAAAGSAYARASVFLGNGDGSFRRKCTYETLTGSLTIGYAVALGDLNGDNVLDLATCGQAYSTGWHGQTSVLLGRGDGTFGPKVTLANEICLVLEVGDLNRDGILDLVTAGSANDGSATQGHAAVMLGRGDGNFAEECTYATESLPGAIMGASYSVALGDLNGDGVLDLATAGYVRVPGLLRMGQASVLIGRGDGTFGDKATYGTHTGTGLSNWTYASGLGDLNKDGVLDLAATGYSSAGNHLTVFTGITREGISPILPFSLATMADARQAMGLLDNKLTALLSQRGKIGAFQSRLQTANNTLYSACENFAAASGRIMDADVAEEAANLTRTQILQQAGAAVLAQANQQPSLALQLLKG